MMQLPRHIAHEFANDLAAADAALTPEAETVLRRIATGDVKTAFANPLPPSVPTAFREHARELSSRIDAYRLAHPERPNAVAVVLRSRIQQMSPDDGDPHRPMTDRDLKAARRASLGIPKLYAFAKLSNFDVRGDTPADSDALVAARKWGAEFVRGWPNRADLAGGSFPLFSALLGPSGVGKTHLVYAVGSALASEHDALPIFTTAGALCDEIRDAFGRDRGEAGVRARVNRYTKADVLFVDECNRGSVRGDAASLVAEVVETREREGRPTVFASIEALEALEVWLGAPVISRLIRWRAIIELPCTDYRAKLAFSRPTLAVV